MADVVRVTAHAGGWLIIITAIAGIILLSLTGWLLDTLVVARGAARRGPGATMALVVEVSYQLLKYALIARIIASWFGLFRHSKWIRPAYILTDWIVEPIRRIVPPLGAMDLSPLVAWFALWMLRRILVSLFLGIG